MDRSHVVIAFLLGVVVALGASIGLQQPLPAAHAQTAGGASNVFAVTGSGTQGQSRDVLFVLDPESRRLCVYEYKDGSLALGAVRNMEFELRFQEWSQRGKSQNPSVGDVRKLSEKEPPK